METSEHGRRKYIHRYLGTSKANVDRYQRHIVRFIPWPSSSCLPSIAKTFHTPRHRSINSIDFHSFGYHGHDERHHCRRISDFAVVRTHGRAHHCRNRTVAFDTQGRASAHYPRNVVPDRPTNPDWRNSKFWLAVSIPAFSPARFTWSRADSDQFLVCATSQF